MTTRTAKHISEVLKKNPPKKGKATRRKQGKRNAKERVIVIPAVEEFANQNRFILPKPKSGKKTKSNPDGAGRPTVVSQEVVRKLEDAFCYDSTVEEACLLAGIGKSTYYAFVKDQPAFSERVDELRQAPYLVIRRKVIQVSEHDADMGLKFLERKLKMEFSTRAEVSHSGEVINRHHVDPEQAALIHAAMGNFARKVKRDAEEKKEAAK